MNNREVCHVWASQNRDAGKGSNLFFDGPVIYSYGYHFPIARMILSVCLFTSEGYSSATAKHKSYVRGAIGGHVHTFIVPDVLADSETAHAGNLSHIVAAREAAILAAARARSNGDAYIKRAERLADDARAYAAVFNLPAPDLAPVSPELLADAQAKAKKASEARAKETAARKAERAERERSDLAAYQEKLDAWKTGAAVTVPYRNDEPTALRVKGDVIETSRGAVVPRSVAPGLWAAACTCRKNGETMRPETRGAAGVGDYSLREIRDDGAIVVGCHVLEFSELSRMAAALGLPAIGEG